MKHTKQTYDMIHRCLMCVFKILTLMQERTNRHCLGRCPVEIFTFSELLKSSVNVSLLQCWVNILSATHIHRNDRAVRNAWFTLPVKW